MKEFLMGKEPLRWPNPEKDARRKNFTNPRLIDHRFLISTNPEAENLIHKIKDAVKTLQDQHSGVIGFALHGSLIKGYATNMSDIDGYLLIDTEKEDPPQDVNDKNKYIFGWKLELSNLMEKEFKHLISVESNKTKDVVTLQSVDKNTIKHYFELEDWGTLSIFFLLTLGDNRIREYRKFILDTLKKDPQGELFWKFILEDLIINENIGFDPEIIEKRQKLYPRTIEEAQRYFKTEIKRKL